MDKSLYKNKIMVTGHTGFKGSWMCEVLIHLGANVIGYALEPTPENDLFNKLELSQRINSHIGDIRDLKHLRDVFEKECPDIVIHMAAQPIVRTSYEEPVYTYETNVMGTVNVMESIRLTDSVRSFVNVTTDKVYRNYEKAEGYKEDEELNGYDPYSNSKSCSELVTDSYRNSFFGDRDVSISACRAGNVIGGGDYAKDRVIPDCVRAAAKDKEIIIRNPKSERPFQHVLEPVCAYLYLAMKQYGDKSYQGCYNIGPEPESHVNAGQIADMFCEAWKKHSGKTASWKAVPDGGPHETGCLRLDISKIKQRLNWAPMWDIKTTIDKTVEWYACYESGGDFKACMDNQIEEYLALLGDLR
ncbi:MAG: CDP-glucose 4,6-dehydratase [Lachnospiraceae bacterium]|nr:CDP-glucose 4,6-dehydratase [Lachnospiraceae bacterium]